MRIPVARRPLATMIVAGLALGGLLACDGPSETPSSEPAGIVLIVVDTLRADRLGAYGGVRGLTPFLDSLALRGAVYRDAIAPSSWTVPSIASMLTSRYASQHAAIGFDSRLPDAELSFVERLREAGFATGGVSANPRLEDRFGYAQGFDHWEVLKHPRRKQRLENRKVRAARVRERALRWLDTTRAVEPRVPYFLYVHLMEPHSPYMPPAVTREQFAGPVEASTVERVNRKLLNLKDLFGEALTSDELSLLVDLYDAEVAAVDAELAQLFADFEERGVLDEALVVVTSDHGEDFREHGRVLHGFTLYEPSIRIPLIVLGPGVEAGRVSEANVSLIDLAPTFLEVAGLPPEERFEGRSLGVRETEPVDRLSELLEDTPSHGARIHSAALVRGPHKLLQRHDGGRELFDLSVDAGEQRPNPDALAAVANELGLRLDGLASRLAEGSRAPEVEPLDDDTAEALRALGYAVEE